MGKSSGGGGAPSITKMRADLDQAVQSGKFRIATSQVPVQRVVDGRIVVDLESSEYPDFTEAVSKGAQLLDEVDPEWFLHIKTDALNLDDQNMCVLGQTWNHYKTIDAAVANTVQTQESNNFNRFLRALRRKNKLGGDYAYNGAEHGFAFTAEVYYWCHVEAQRRVDAGIYSDIASSDIPGKRHRSWDLDAEVWEHLTKTWLVLIEARQKAHAKAQAEKESDLSLALFAAGVTNPPADEIAKKMVARGIYTVAEALTSLAQDPAVEKQPQTQPKVETRKEAYQRLLKAGAFTECCPDAGLDSSVCSINIRRFEEALEVDKRNNRQLSSYTDF